MQSGVGCDIELLYLGMEVQIPVECDEVGYLLHILEGFHRVETLRLELIAHLGCLGDELHDLSVIESEQLLDAVREADVEHRIVEIGIVAVVVLHVQRVQLCDLVEDLLRDTRVLDDHSDVEILVSLHVRAGVEVRDVHVVLVDDLEHRIECAWHISDPYTHHQYGGLRRGLIDV